LRFRRVVTGIRDGKSTVMHDGVPPTVFGGDGSDLQTAEVWATDPIFPDCASYRDITEQFEQFDLALQPGESRFRLMEFAAGGDFAMHASPTIDYIDILEGEIDLELEDGTEVHLTPGDSVVQRGVMHAWHVRSDKPCQIAGVIIGADPLPDGDNHEEPG
jgi:quercetin dioxygenase-like cupin family protein